jgi:hypothetical protein
MKARTKATWIAQWEGLKTLALVALGILAVIVLNLLAVVAVEHLARTYQ